MNSVNDELNFWVLSSRLHAAGYAPLLGRPDWKCGLLDSHGVTIVARYDDLEKTFTGTSFPDCMRQAVEFAEANPSVEFAYHHEEFL
ncbi:hypothetical protein GYB59_02205 [bacterium]|nr:hypothetical protein [bacterium]